MRTFLILVLFLLSGLACASVYTYIDQNGSQAFSDSIPANDQTRTKVETIPTYHTQASPVPVAQAVVTTVKTKEMGTTSTVPEVIAYRTFEILSPKNQETFQNQPQISIVYKIDPGLAKGDMVQPLLDGRPWGEPASSETFSIKRPDRGTHTLSGQLINSQKLVLRTAPSVTVFIHQAHLGNPVR